MLPLCHLLATLDHDAAEHAAFLDPFVQQQVPLRPEKSATLLRREGQKLNDACIRSSIHIIESYASARV